MGQDVIHAQDVTRPILCRTFRCLRAGEMDIWCLRTDGSTLASACSVMRLFTYCQKSTTSVQRQQRPNPAIHACNLRLCFCSSQILLQRTQQCTGNTWMLMEMVLAASAHGQITLAILLCPMLKYVQKDEQQKNLYEGRVSVLGSTDASSAASPNSRIWLRVNALRMIPNSQLLYQGER